MASDRELPWLYYSQRSATGIPALASREEGDLLSDAARRIRFTGAGARLLPADVESERLAELEASGY